MQFLIRKIARLSRVCLAALVVTGLVAMSLFALFGEKVLRTEVERRLNAALGRPVTVGALTVNLPQRTVELRDLVIPGLPGSKRPSLVAPRVKVALSFRSLFTSRILLRGLELDRPQFCVRILPDGSTDLSRPALKEGSSSRQLSIGRIQVRAGELFLNDQRIPVDLVLPNFEALLTEDAPSSLRGDLSAGPGSLRFGDLPAEDARLALGFRFARSTLKIDSGSFQSAGTNLSLAGELDLHEVPKGEIRLSGPFDLEGFDRSMVRTGLDLRGIAQSKAILSIDGEKQILTGRLLGQHGSYQSIPIDTFETNFWWDGSDLRFKELTLQALGGKALLDVQVPENAPVSVAGSLARLDAEPLLHWLFDFGSAGLGSRVSGPIDLTFPRGASNLLNGTGDLEFSPDPGLGDPLAGRFPFRAAKGVVIMSGARLEAPKNSLTLDGSILPDRSLHLAVKLRSDDLAATDDLAVRVRRALGARQPEFLGATGQGRFQGRVLGTTEVPIFTGGFIGAGVSYLGVSWGDVNWSGTASALDLKNDSLTVTRGSARVDLSGTQRLGAGGVDDAMDLSVVVKGWPAKDLLQVVNSKLEVDGAVSGTFRLLGKRSLPLGEAQLTSARGKAVGVPYTQAELKLKFEGEALRIEDLNATVGGGDLLVKGLITDEAGVPAFDGEMEIRAVEISDLGFQTGGGPAIGGHVDGRARLSGPVERPRVSAHFESKRIFYGDEGIGAVTLGLEGKGDGVLTVAGRADSPRFLATVSGSIEAKPPHVSRLEVNLASARLDPVLRALGSRFENAVVITASAKAQVEGPLADPDAISARVREGGLRIAVPEYAIEAVPGFVIDIEKSAVQIAGLTLTGEGTSLGVSGKLALKSDDLNNLSVTGRADLRVLTGFLREWRVRGSATLRSQISGSPKSIRLTGGLDLEDGAIRLRTFPQGLEGLNGRIVFNETQARVAGLEGRFGGGRVSVSGQMGFGGAVPASFDLSFTGDSLGLRYPEGLRSMFGASLRLQGTAESHWLTGTLLVSKATWTRKYAITSELFASPDETTGFSRTSAGLEASPMRLDVAIKAPGTLRLDNNLASLTAKADLTLTGSPTEPQLLGQVEVERGKVFFRGNTYDVRKGVAHFSNPRAINPVFDIEADTRVRSYRLTLQANGTLDRVSTRITSDPPLTSPQIASLLTGGDESDVASLAGSVTDLRLLGFGGANSLASSWLDDNLTGRVAQGFGLSRLSIDPGKGRLLNPTGSRLTVGKRLTDDLEVVYSRNIFGGKENQLATVEYSITNRFSLVAGWTEPGGFSGDVRTRIVLGR